MPAKIVQITSRFSSETNPSTVHNSCMHRVVLGVLAYHKYNVTINYECMMCRCTNRTKDERSSNFNTTIYVCSFYFYINIMKDFDANIIDDFMIDHIKD